jgi:hypothetical protein
MFLAPLGYLKRAALDGQETDPRPGACLSCATRIRRSTRRVASRSSRFSSVLRQQASGLGRVVRLGSQAIRDAPAEPTLRGYYRRACSLGVRGKRGDFEPLISEEVFHRAQAVRSGTHRKQSAAPAKPSRFSAPNFVRCARCGRALTGSWSRGRSDYYAYYHCRPGCRAVNVSKAKLEELFAMNSLTSSRHLVHAITQRILCFKCGRSAKPPAR